MFFIRVISVRGRLLKKLRNVQLLESRLLIGLNKIALSEGVEKDLYTYYGK